MAIVATTEPTVRTKMTTKRVMLELLIALVFVLIGSLISIQRDANKDGTAQAIRAVSLIGISVLTAAAVEAIWFRFIKNIKSCKAIIDELLKSFSWITAIILTLSLPSYSSIYAIVIATIAAILIGKLLFGGFGNNVFNPAAVGRAVYVFGIAVVVSTVAKDLSLGVGGATSTTGINIGGTISSLTDPSKIGAVIKQLTWTNTLEFFGIMNSTSTTIVKFGAMAEMAAVFVLIAGIVLAIRKVLDWRVLVTYVGAFAIWVFLSTVAFVDGASINDAGMFTVVQLGVGGLLFGAVFMATDPVTMPQHPAGRVVFGLGLAFFTFLIRFSTTYPEGVLFAILLMNMLSPTIEKIFVGNMQSDKQRQIVVVSSIAVVLSAVVLASAYGLWG